MWKSCARRRRRRDREVLGGGSLASLWGSWCVQCSVCTRQGQSVRPHRRIPSPRSSQAMNAKASGRKPMEKVNRERSE